MTWRESWPGDPTFDEETSVGIKPSAIRDCEVVEAYVDEPGDVVQEGLRIRRIGPGTIRDRERSASLVATFLLTMRGTPFVYQGEEIGMTNGDFERLEDVADPMTVGMVEEAFADGVVDTYEEIRGLVNYRSRDHGRTPMQWVDEPAAGFTDGEPWLAVNDNYPTVNVDAQRTDERSIWNQYRALVDLRHDEDVLVYGTYDLLLPDHEQLYAYVRTLGDETTLVVLNWSAESATFDCDRVETSGWEVLYANTGNPPTDPIGATLDPYEAVVYRL